MLKQTSFALVALALFSAPACFVAGDDEDDESGGSGGEETGGTGATGGTATGGTGGRGTAEPGEPCADTQECVPGSICFNRFCVGEGTLRISLAFNVDSDYDLHVLTPAGSEIYFANETANGGTLDVDQCVESCGTTTHVENVVFEGTAPAGMYTVWVVNWNGRAGGNFSIEVAGDVNTSFTGTLPATSMAESTHFTFTR